MPYRIVGDGAEALVQLLLVTTRTTGRWIIPKGNVDFNMSPYRAAEQEAEEEAGVRGEIARQPIGVFRYRKRLCSGITATAKVVVFPLRVTEELDDWQERSVRLRKWFSADEAMEAVGELDLREIIRSFWPRSP
ncbi:MAG TPA: NUDIX hydrolase [Sphingomicrobium sp.]|nr:NUDIX hydrolase [Sphingomicrobium sp.]